MLKLTSIVDNVCLRHSYIAQHGQSILIEDEDQKILFDTSEIYAGLKANLNNLHVSFNQLDAIVVSHQHFDHCGALPEVLDQLSKPAPLFVPEVLWTPESVEAQQSSYILDTSHGGNVVDYSSMVVVANSGIRISEHVFLTGPVEGKVKEQAVVLKLNPTDIVLVVGCSHPGTQSLVERALSITQTSHVVGIVGGMHFKDMNQSEIDNQVEYLKSLELKFIIPGHCTGVRAAEALRAQQPHFVKTSGAGSFGVGNSIQVLPELKFDFV